MKKVLGIGNALVDILIRLENDDLLSQLNLKKGSMQLVDANFKKLVLDKTKHLRKAQASGGSSANTIHGLASLGTPTAYIGKVGNDEFGKFFTKDLISNNIKPHLQTSSTETGVACALISPDSERTFGTYLGAAVEVGPEDLHPELFHSYDILHIEGYLVFNEALIVTAVKMAKERNMTVSLDLASYNIVEAKLDFLRELTLEYVDIVFANEEEAKAFTGKEPEEAVDEIAEMCNTAVVKVGKKGALVKSGPSKIIVEAIPANVIDTTGAGDLYAAGFLYGYANGLSLKTCGEFGALLAGKVIEVIGAKIPTETWNLIKKEIKKRDWSIVGK
jgi:sugar/nucleoside kinase (ribokinase family)